MSQLLAFDAVTRGGAEHLQHLAFEFHERLHTGHAGAGHLLEPQGMAILHIRTDQLVAAAETDQPRAFAGEDDAHLALLRRPLTIVAPSSSISLQRVSFNSAFTSPLPDVDDAQVAPGCEPPNRSTTICSRGGPSIDGRTSRRPSKLTSKGLVGALRDFR